MPPIQCKRCLHTFKQGVVCPKCRACVVAQTSHALTMPGADADGTILIDHVPDVDPVYLQTGHWDPNFATPPGIPNDCVMLIAGVPGAGKSTFALQLAYAMAKKTGRQALYIPAEENERQLRARARRLGFTRDKGLLRIVPKDVLREMTDESFPAMIKRWGIGTVIVDSISKLVTNPNGAAGFASMLKQVATDVFATVLLIGHVNKEELAAGNMDLQHEGDGTLLLTKTKKGRPQKVRYVLTPAEVERGREPHPWFTATEVRELYTEKNRYGEDGISTFYVMGAEGLVPVEYEDEPDEDDFDDSLKGKLREEDE